MCHFALPSTLGELQLLSVLPTLGHMRLFHVGCCSSCARAMPLWFQYVPPWQLTTLIIFSRAYLPPSGTWASVSVKHWKDSNFSKGILHIRTFPTPYPLSYSWYYLSLCSHQKYSPPLTFWLWTSLSSSCSPCSHLEPLLGHRQVHPWFTLLLFLQGPQRPASPIQLEPASRKPHLCHLCWQPSS